MPDDLAGRLLRAGLLTRDQLAAALSSAPLHGGVLVRELVARGVSEDALAGFFLSEGFGPVMDRSDLHKADAAALARLSAELSVDLLALPVRASPAGLVVAMAAPSDRHSVREVERAAGGEVLPMVARLGDLLEALRAAHPSVEVPAAVAATPATLSSHPPESEPPVLMLVRRRDRKSDPDAPNAGDDHEAPGASTEAQAPAAPAPSVPPEEEDAPLPLVRTKAHGTPAAGVDRPIAEEPPRRVIARTFGKPVRRSLVPGPAPGPGPAATAEVQLDKRSSTAEYAIPASEAPAASKGKAEQASSQPAQIADAEPEGILAPASEPPGRTSLPDDATRIEASSPSPAASLIPPEHARWDAGEQAPAPSAAEPEPDRRRSMRPGTARASASRPRSARPSAPLPAQDKPADIGSILSNMRSARERDDVVRLACEGALTVARASVFLALRKGVLKGWDGRGGSLSRDAVRNLWLPTTSASTFSDVVRERTPRVGPYGPSVADGVFRAAVASRGGSLAVYPVSVSDRVVGVLCADGLSDDTLAAERIETLAHAVAEAFKRIIVGNK